MMKTNLKCALSVMAGVFLGVASAATTVKVVPSAGDATPAYLDAVAQVRAAGGGVIDFAVGEYVFAATSATKLTFPISNHNQTDPHAVQLPLMGLTNVTLRAHGSTFLVDGAAIGFTIIDCANVRIEGVKLDWTRPFITDAVVDGFENGKTRVTVDPVKFPHVWSNDYFYATGTGWALPVRYMVVSRGDTHALVEGTTDYLLKPGQIESAGPNTYLLSGDFAHWGAGVRKGDVFAFRAPNRTCPGVVIYRAKDTVFEDVSIHSSWGMGIICQFSENFTWRGTGKASDRTAGVFVRDGTGRFYSANADASHFSNVRGKVLEENLLFEGMMDDAINVHATSVRIIGKPAPDTLRCRFMHKEAYGFTELFKPGDRLRFIKGPTFENGPTMKVKSVALEADGYEMTIVLKHSVPAEYDVGDAVENAEAMPEIVFRNNIVGHNRARGALFATTGDVWVESNLFDRVSGSAILFPGDAQGWFESGAIRRAVVRGNVFRNCNASYFQFCDGIIACCPMIRDIANQKHYYHRNIAIVDNVFETFKTALVYARSTENLVITGNRTIYNDDIAWCRPYKGEIVTERCRDVKTDDAPAPMIWGVLLHLGANMWWDEPQDCEEPHDRNWTSCAKDHLICDDAAWRTATDAMIAGGLNMVVIDLGEGVVYPNHPELAVKGSWSPAKLKAEIARLRAAGLEVVPKLNFSACHDIWLKQYSRMLSTPTYYKVCADVIKDVRQIFGKTRYFHIGFDEEQDHPFQSYIVIRKGDLWWHDFRFFKDEVERDGARAWVWSDAVWRHRKRYLEKMPRTVMQSNWYYYKSFDLAKLQAQKSPVAVEVESYGILDDAGYDQIPTGSNWDNDTNFADTVAYCRKVIAPSRLKGFLQAPWAMTTQADLPKLLKGIEQIIEAKRTWQVR